MTTSNLPNSEQLGRVGCVRDYYTDTAVGSEAIMASQEIRFPVFNPSGLMDLGTSFNSVPFWITPSSSKYAL